MNESSAYKRKGISHKVEGLGASIHGGRPNFALKKSDKNYTVYELLPQEQADAFKERWKNNRKVKRQIKIVEADFIEDEDLNWDDWKAAKIARLDQSRFDSCRSLLKKLLAESEKSYNDLLKTTDTLILLPESIGVQVALAFRGIKPLKRVDKQREFIRQLEKMDVEECYYWHSLCRSPSTPNGAKALRELLVGHME
ncbi:MAG: DUF7680 family protein [Thermoplasmatota archaeon]